MKELTFYLHIGDGKTGTSIIQNFLDVNRQKLFKDLGFLYPNFFADDLSTGRAHNHAPWYNTVKNDHDKFFADIDRLEKFAKDHLIEKIILSNEAWILDDNAFSMFQELVQRKENIELRTITYLRRMDFWVESAWKQWGLKTDMSIEEYCTHENFLTRFERILTKLDAWAELIGLDNVVVRPYEKQQLPNGLLHDFISQLGIDYTAHQWNQTENLNKATNAGFNRDVLEVLHDCRELYPDIANNHLFDLFTNLLGESFQKKPFENYALLSPEKRHFVLSHNLPAERQIAQKYMGRLDGRIFYDPMPNPDEDWEPYEGLDLHKAIPIIVKMIDQNNQLIMENRRRINNLKKKQPLISKSTSPGQTESLPHKVLRKTKQYLKPIYTKLKGG